MTRSILTNSTALALCLSLSLSGSLLAQGTQATAADQKAALNEVAAAIESGNTPTAVQIDRLDRKALRALAKMLDIKMVGMGAMSEEDLRELIKMALGVEAGGSGAASVPEVAEEPTPKVADIRPAPKVTETEPAPEVVEAEPAPEAVEVETAPEVVETEPAPEVVEVEPTPEVVEVQPAPEAEASVETAPERPERSEREVTGADLAVTLPKADEVEAVRGMVTEADINAMTRPHMIRLMNELNITIKGAEGMSADELRTNLKAALGMPTQVNPAVVTAAPPAAAMEDAEMTAEGRVTVETLTESDVRSSDEEFQTDVVVPGSVEAPANSGDSDDNRRKLSNAETAAALGLGVLALSQILGSDDEVVSNSGDRVVVRRGTELEVIRDDDVLLRRPGNKVETRSFDDGSTRTIVTRPNGVQVITVRAADGTVIRRVRVRPDGTRVVIFDDTAKEVAPVDTTILPEPQRDVIVTTESDSDALEAALNAELSVDLDRRFTLRQVRSIREVRHLMPEVTLDAINFRTDSSVILATEAEELAELGRQMAEFIADNPDEIFLVEGHTDTVGSAVYNLALSDRRAESVALALIEYFDVPPENLVIQGYGESDLLVRREGDIRANRRATVRRITPLLRRTAANVQ